MDPLALLKSTYSANVNNNLFDKWLDEMYLETDIDSKRILISIAIDTKFRPKVVNNYTKLFKLLDFKEDVERPCLRLKNVMKISNTMFFDENGTNKYYVELVRILSKSVFHLYYLSKAKYSSNNDNSNKIKVEAEIIMHDSIGNLQQIEIESNRSKESWSPVFVTFKSEIDRLFTENDGSAFADVINNELGLCKEANEELIKLIYPLSFNEMTYQPITINSDIEATENVYLSYKSTTDFCGRTRSNLEDKFVLGAKERVHKPISKSYLYKWEKIGKVSNEKIDTSNILNDALKRYDDK